MGERLMALMKNVVMHVMHHILPWTSLLKSDTDKSKITHDGGIEGAKQGLQYSLERNFGELEFDWEHRTVTIRSIGEDPMAPPLLAARVNMDQLSGRTPMSSSTLTQEDFSAEAALQHPLLDGSEWACLEHRGQVSVAREMFGYANAVFGIASIFSVPVLLPAYFMCLLWRKRRTRTPATRSSSAPVLKKQISF
jgi:hypothetical protein